MLFFVTRTGQTAVMRLLLFLFSAFLLLAVLLPGVCGFLFYRAVHAPGPADVPLVIYFPAGTPVSLMAGKLDEAGAVRHAGLFKAAVRIQGRQDSLKAGEYEIPAGASIADIVHILEEGKSLLHFMTVPEGLTTARVIRLLEDNDLLTGTISLDPQEGALLPETYAFTRGETRDSLVRRMMQAHETLVTGLWEQRRDGLPFRTPLEAVILASVVERETAFPAERRRVAAVFVNRLNRGMRLESDPTVIYGLTGGEPLGRGLRRSEIRLPTPYNTYVISGLPPLPISNPGRESIRAVFDPEETEELFFVADGKGGHAFSETLDEHRRHVKAWRAVERARRQESGR